MEITFIPNQVLVLIGFKESTRRHWNVILSATLLISVLALAPLLHLLFQIPHVCLFDYFLGIPCPGCGLLRSLSALSQGNFAAAYAFNPVGILVGLFLLGQIPARLLIVADRLKAERFLPLNRMLEKGIVIAIFTGWLVRING